jgi:protocatechuate 3,4-dioxygenase beta subunit
MHDHHDDDHRDTAAPHAGPGPTDGDVRGAHDEREAADHDHDHRHTRRTLVGVAGAVGAGAMLSQLGVAGGLFDRLGLDDEAQAATAACVLTPQKTEGPYFVEEGLNRSDIRVDPSDGTTQDGVALALTLVIVDGADGCTPVGGATVDVWHANALGKYSDIQSEGTKGRKFLRGSQVTDADGKVAFTTIFPGWYSGRAIHIHFKVRLFDGTSTTYEFTSQLFFDPTLENQVVQTSAYGNRGTPDTPNSRDGIYGSDGGTLVVALTGDPSSSLSGTHVIGVSNAPATTTTPSTGSTGTGTGTGTGTTTTPAATAAVDAAVTSVRWVRTSTGRRILRLTLYLDETVAVDARLIRSGRTLVRKKRAALKSGARTLDLRIPVRSARGKARLAVTFTDTAAATKSVRRTVTVPKKA